MQNFRRIPPNEQSVYVSTRKLMSYKTQKNQVGKQ